MRSRLKLQVYVLIVIFFLKAFYSMLHTRSSMLDKVDQVFNEIVYAHDYNTVCVELDQA